jgi:regulatory protein
MKKDALVLALKKLSYRAYSEKELDSYLAKAGFNQEQREEVLQKLLSWGYLNDQKLAVYWFEYYIKHKPLGYTCLYKKLQEKGIPHEYILTVLAEYDEKKELELGRSLAEKFISKKTKREPVIHLKESLARHLQRKGFSGANITKILSDNFPE